MPDNNTSKNSLKRKPAVTPIDTGLGHLPPQSLETERLVLGALMIDKDAFTKRKFFSEHQSLNAYSAKSF